jgi:hypothetical protein
MTRKRIYLGLALTVLAIAGACAGPEPTSPVTATHAAAAMDSIPMLPAGGGATTQGDTTCRGGLIGGGGGRACSGT